jgi:hypothetical protein
LVVAEIVEEEFWRQRKVQRCALLLFLATAGLAIGVGVALNGGGDGSVTLLAVPSESPSASAVPSVTPSAVPSVTSSAVPLAAPTFDCSNGRNTDGECLLRFTTTSELQEAVDFYLVEVRHARLTGVMFFRLSYLYCGHAGREYVT